MDVLSDNSCVLYLSNLRECIDGVRGLKGMDVDIYSICLTRKSGNV